MKNILFKIPLIVLVFSQLSCENPSIEKEQEQELSAQLPFPLVGNERVLRLRYLGAEEDVMGWWSYDFETEVGEKLSFNSDVGYYNTADKLHYNNEYIVVVRHENAMSGMEDVSGDWMVYIQRMELVVFAAEELVNRATMFSSSIETINSLQTQLTKLSATDMNYLQF